MVRLDRFPSSLHLTRVSPDSRHSHVTSGRTSPISTRIRIAEAAPYFVDGDGQDWTPVGHNDSIAWPNLAPLFGRRDPSAVEAHLFELKANGVTCLRLMMECAQSRHRYFERPFGRFNPAMVRLWDDLFTMCARIGLRILLTPFDTFWTWVRWRHHPYNICNGGPLKSRTRLLLDPQVREAAKARLAFAAERWGGSGALFAWDLWNEIHPAQAEDDAQVFDHFIHDLSTHLRQTEMRCFGDSHLQTVSLFGPELDRASTVDLTGPIFRHPDLDFATIHIYASGTIDHPRNTVDPAIAMGRIVQESLVQTPAGRPFLDTEHGPIHTFKDKRRTLPQAFDDEMFRHMQWAHLASGGVGGGMRWPNRRPHVLTPGMHREQRRLSAFLPRVDWKAFNRRNITAEVVTAPGKTKLAVFGCGDGRQALIYLLRRDTLGAEGRLAPGAAPIAPLIRLLGLERGEFSLMTYDPTTGELRDRSPIIVSDDRSVSLTAPSFTTSSVLFFRRIGSA